MHHSYNDRRYLIPFRSALLPHIFTDVLVIGSGVAGLQAALTAASHSEVICVTKGDAAESNTFYAQGGIAAVLGEHGQEGDDSIEDHIRDTLSAGGDLCEERTVRRIVEEANDAIEELLQLGIHFDRDDAGKFRLGREGGHSTHRILHSEGDATGRAFVKTLTDAVRSNEKIRLFDQCRVLDLITEGDRGSRCLGAITHHQKYGLQIIWAKATILAAGGCGQVYRETTNPSVATGDGITAAFRAGAKVADLEFMQFHPTTLYVAGAGRALISEAVRGEGAYLVDRNGHRFMQGVHKLAELAPRDIVSRAILDHIASTNNSHAFLDARHIGTERFTARFPRITQLLNRFDLDPGRDLIPIHPSAHYMIGGVWVDELTRTNLSGLYACGEAACTGLHGANRLASNSLLEGLVCGRVAGRQCEEMMEMSQSMPTKIVSDIRPSDRSGLDVSDVRSSLASVMWRQVGIVRNGERLEEVNEMFDFWARYMLDKIFDEHSGWEVQNLLFCGALMTRAAVWRNESRGTHFRSDYPKPSSVHRAHNVWTVGESDPESVRVDSVDVSRELAGSS